MMKNVVWNGSHVIILTVKYVKMHLRWHGMLPTNLGNYEAPIMSSRFAVNLVK
jgi:hypothetical protein